MRAIVPATSLETSPPRIVAVQSPANAAIQEFLSDLAIMWRTAGLHVAGVLDQVVPHFMSGHRVERVLFNIATGARHPITQNAMITKDALSVLDLNGAPRDLWRAPAWRRDDAPGFAAACCGVESALQGVCHVVILSRFGKAEMEGGGLRNAFLAAFDAGVPVVTAVSPCAEESWIRFTRGASVFVNANQEDIETWRLTVARTDARAWAARFRRRQGCPLAD
jgi:hypothetical protein